MTTEDPVLRHASEVVGGPSGRRSAGHPWWTPVRVLLAVGCLFWLFAMVQKTPCEAAHWSGDNLRYDYMCYSDIPYLYVGRGFAERQMPYVEDDPTYQALEYPVGIGVFAYLGATVNQWVHGNPDLEARRALPADQSVGSLPEVEEERQSYFLVTAVLLTPFALLAAYFMAGAHRRRPWDALGYVAAPAMVVAGLINWDILAVACVAGVFWAWSRGKPVLAGVMVGLGTVMKLYPMFLLGALLIVCLRRRRMSLFVRTTLAALLTWLACNVPFVLLNRDGWAYFWSFNSGRGPDLGSLWIVGSIHDHAASAHTVNLVSWAFFAAACLAILVLGLRVKHVPRVAQLAYLIVMSFLLVNKVYSPQYVLWLLPLAVLAVPRWKPLLLWQAAELFYFASVWWYLAGYTASGTTDAADPLYTVAIVVRVLAELGLGAVIVRDMLRPEHDTVRAFPDDDPACPEDMLAPSPAPGTAPGTPARVLPSGEDDLVEVRRGEPHLH